VPRADSRDGGDPRSDGGEQQVLPLRALPLRPGGGEVSLCALQFCCVDLTSFLMCCSRSIFLLETWQKWRGLEEQVRSVLNGYPDLRLTKGRKVLEIRPSIKWDKGNALQFLLEALGEYTYAHKSVSSSRSLALKSNELLGFLKALRTVTMFSRSTSEMIALMRMLSRYSDLYHTCMAFSLNVHFFFKKERSVRLS
jgi:hypothetical protein